MTRPPEDIRAEIARWRAFIHEQRPIVDLRRGKDATPRERNEGESASIEAAGPAIIVSALTWSLGETESPTVRVKM